MSTRRRPRQNFDDMMELARSGALVIIRSDRPFGTYELIVWPDPSRPEHHHEKDIHLFQCAARTVEWTRKQSIDIQINAASTCCEIDCKKSVL
jgi:hypothetical protein